MQVDTQYMGAEVTSFFPQKDSTWAQFFHTHVDLKVNICYKGLTWSALRAFWQWVQSKTFGRYVEKKQPTRSGPASSNGTKLPLKSIESCSSKCSRIRLH